MAPSYVDLIQMRHPAVARGDGDVFELHVHVVLGCETGADVLAGSGARAGREPRRTFEQLAPVDLAGSDLESNNVTLDECHGVSDGSVGMEFLGHLGLGWYT